MECLGVSMPRHAALPVRVLVLASVLVVGAFQLGRAGAVDRADRRRTPVVEAVRHAAPAVLSVYAWGRGSGTRGSGAGVIVHPAGFVVTNSHVIRGASRVTVKPFGQRSNFPARILADEPGSDLALLQIEGGRTWSYVSLAATREVMLGETAIAIGNPHGLGDTVTVGIVSAVDRPAKIASGATLRNLIQTDASINSGNSGGALLNLDGELIGINASILPTAKGIAFAIPSDQVADLLGRTLGPNPPPRNGLPQGTPSAPPALPDPERVASIPPRIERVPPPQVGGAERAREVPPPSVVQGPDVRIEEEPEPVPLRPSDLGFEIEDVGCGLVVTRIAAGGPAARGGLLTGDTVLDVDGIPVEAEGELVLALASSYPGRRFFLNVRRGAVRASVVLAVPR
jgi:S1-C subfamily serine protease